MNQEMDQGTGDRRQETGFKTDLLDVRRFSFGDLRDGKDQKDLRGDLLL